MILFQSSNHYRALCKFRVGQLTHYWRYNFNIVGGPFGGLSSSIQVKAALNQP